MRRAFDSLKSSLDGEARLGEAMSRHTTYRIGGSAALFVVADTLSDLKLSLDVFEAEELPFTVLGKGSNVLVADEGYTGAVLVLGREFRRHEIGDEHVHAGAGTILAHIVQDAFSKGRAGLEFAVGIPGTLGGALIMNAGSRDEWIESVVESVTLYVPGKGLAQHRGTDIGWGYRTSDLRGQGIVIEASLRTAEGDPSRIRRAMEESLRRRKSSQPLGVPSAGSVFRNPDGESAGQLIEEVGLKGASEGGAAISEVHANFIVNNGGATARDVLALMRRARDAVRDTYGIELEPEIRFLGSFDEP